MFRTVCYPFAKFLLNNIWYGKRLGFLYDNYTLSFCQYVNRLAYFLFLL